ncbi:MAG: hypothetical protein ACN4E2_07430 [Nitrospinota bacterium]
MKISLLKTARQLALGLILATNLILFVACGSSSDSSNSSDGSNHKRLFDPALQQLFEHDLIVVTTDYTGYGSASIFNSTSSEISNDLIKLHSDTVGRVIDDRLFFIERSGADSLIEAEFNVALNEVNILNQFSTSPGSNPHDMLLISPSRAFIGLYEKSGLPLFDISESFPEEAPIKGEIDLSTYADDDGIPEIDLFFEDDDNIYFTISNMDRDNDWQPSEKGSKIIAIQKDQLSNDDLSDVTLSEIDLPLNNPSDIFRIDEERVLIALTGSYSDYDDGGIVEFNLSDHTTKIVATGTDLGGNISNIAMIDEDEGFVIVSKYLDSQYITELKYIKLNDDADLEISLLPSDASASFNDIVVIGSKLIVADRDYEKPGIRLFDTTTREELPDSPISTGKVPPFELILVN